LTRDDVVVLEVSSYQLEVLPPELGAPDARPDVEAVACVNVLADHLERHGSIEAYAAAKARILELARDRDATAVLPADDEWTARWSSPRVRRLDAWLHTPSEVGLNLHEREFRLDTQALGRVDELRLPGAFQRQNTLIALGSRTSPARRSRRSRARSRSSPRCRTGSRTSESSTGTA
jgi:UDP-N-acetylmuramoylalanine--D-glutamate ligase